MSMFRYYAAKATGQALFPEAVHTNFLRTGRIIRNKENWVEEERRYLTEEEVAARTGTRLENAGRKTHQRLNNFHKTIRFPEIVFHKTLAQAPHLGYVHVTASKADFAEYKDVTWGFYIANFSAGIGGDSAAGQVAGSSTESAGEQFFHHVKPGYSRMYFAVAMKNGEDGKTRKQVINREIRDNGVLFQTADPRTAVKNVLMLGAKTDELRKIVAAIG